MRLCCDCKDEECYSTQYPNSAACEDFTSRAIEEEPIEWQPTLEDYNELKTLNSDIIEALDNALGRLAGYENAVAELVRWAQGDEAP